MKFSDVVADGTVAGVVVQQKVQVVVVVEGADDDCGHSVVQWLSCGTVGLSSM